MHDAQTKIHKFLNNDYEYNICEDNGFVFEIRENVKNVIGYKRFQQLVELSKAAILTPLLYGGKNCGLHYVAISVYVTDDNEKQILQTVLCNVITKYLRVNSCSDDILVEWKYRDDLQMVVLYVRYAVTDEEKRILIMERQIQCKGIIAINSDVIDTEDKEDLSNE